MTASGIPVFALPRPGRVQGWVRARTSPPALAEALVDRVLERYGRRRTGRPANMTMTWRNEIVAVPTDRGRVVLKRYRETAGTPSIEVEHAVLRHLARIGFPAVRLVPTEAGTTVSDGADGRFVVYEHTAGRQFTGRYLTGRQRVAVMRESGRVLARLHRAVADFRPPETDPVGSVPDRAVPVAAIEDALSQLDGLDAAPSMPEPPDLDWMRRRVGWVRAELSALAEQLCGVELPVQLIHGDFGTHNLLFLRDGTAVVHDFELSRLDVRDLDVVVAGLRLEPHSRRLLVEGYREVMGPGAADPELLPVLVRYQLLGGAVRSWRNHARLGDDQRVRTARRRLERVSAAEAFEGWR